MTVPLRLKKKLTKKEWKKETIEREYTNSTKNLYNHLKYVVSNLLDDKERKQRDNGKRISEVGGTGEGLTNTMMI